jgi:hypothetical protein
MLTFKLNRDAIKTLSKDGDRIIFQLVRDFWMSHASTNTALAVHCEITVVHALPILRGTFVGIQRSCAEPIESVKVPSL